MYPRRASINWVAVRIALVACVFGAATLLLVVRAYRLQISDAHRLKERADRQRNLVLHLEARRGMILDRTGEQFAASLEVKSIYARPRKVEDRIRAARELATLLEMDEKEILKKITEDKAFVWVRRKVPPSLTAKVTDANIPGVFSVTEYKRFYPLKKLAAHAVGFAGIDSKGLEGLELYYDRDLKTESVPVTAQKDALGRPVMFAAMAQGPKRRDLHLTLDRNIQYIAAKELEDAVRKEKARSGMALVMDADSGEILALSVQPAYNLNVFHRVPAEVRRNRAVTDTFEPGSTFKVFLASSVLDLGRISPGARFDCENGLYRYRGSKIHDIVPRKVLSFDDVLVYSSNIGSVKISEKLKRGEFYRILKGFGFGTPTGVDLPGERAGSLMRPGKWSAITKANIAFGQGITVNSLQLTTAFAAAVNGGLLYRPFLMKEITNALGETILANHPVLVRRVIKPSTSLRIVQILRRVVRKGTGKAAAIEGVDVIGKTGTAQKADPEGGYSKDKYVASFIGAVMDLKPRLVIFVVIDEPSGRHKTGGRIAAPVFRKIAEGIVSLCGSRPSSAGPLLVKTGPVPKPSDRARRKSVRVKSAKRDGEWIVPDLKGLSMRQVLDACGKIKCDASFHGAGYAVEQHPQPGAVFKEGSTLKVTFKGLES